jgi:serine/threonine protein kinase
MPAVRPLWTDLPEDLRERTACLLGADASEVEWQTQEGGFTPGVALRLASENGRLFLKAIRSDHPLADLYRIEAETMSEMPSFGWCPRQVGFGEDNGWVWMFLEDVPGRYPDLAPGSPDVPLVVGAVARMSTELTPCPVEDARRVKVARAWRSMSVGDLYGTSAAWAIPHLGRLAKLEQWWDEHVDGKTLVHNDLRPDNLLIGEDGRVVVVDWAQARLGHQWRDLSSLVPHMIRAGHSPADAESQLTGTVWGRADPAAITANAVALAGYLIRSSRMESPPDSPYLRGYQKEAADAASAWVRHRTGW